VHKIVIYFYSILSIIFLSNCSDNKFILYAKTDSAEITFNRADIFCKGLNVGSAENSNPGIKLIFLQDVLISKSDTVFVKKNPLGTEYFDIVKSDKIISEDIFYKKFDTIIFYKKINFLSLDSNKVKRIEKQILNTFDSINVILK
jgi:hypothetical protein